MDNYNAENSDPQDDLLSRWLYLSALPLPLDREGQMARAADLLELLFPEKSEEKR
jgi:hypothetical protein